jgi:hypothetical protein
LNKFIEEVVHQKIKKNVFMRTLVSQDRSGLNYLWPEYQILLTSYEPKQCSNQMLIARKSKMKLCSTYKIYTKRFLDSKEICVGKVKGNFNNDFFNIF